MNIDEVLAPLRHGPAAFAALVAQPFSWLRHEPGPGHWTAVQALAHMAALEEDAWLPRVQHLLEHGEAQDLPGVDPLAFERRFPDLDAAEIRRTFSEAREANVQALDDLDLDEAALATRGRHPVLGAVTVGQLLATWVGHDHNHLVQAREAMASRLRHEVGPWTAFLPIVERLGP